MSVLLPIVLAQSRNRCKRDKKVPKPFFHASDMDPEDVSRQLQKLTPVEETLVVRSCTIMRVYSLN